MACGDIIRTGAGARSTRNRTGAHLRGICSPSWATGHPRPNRIHNFVVPFLRQNKPRRQIQLCSLHFYCLRGFLQIQIQEISRLPHTLSRWQLRSSPLQHSLCSSNPGEELLRVYLQWRHVQWRHVHDTEWASSSRQRESGVDKFISLRLIIDSMAPFINYNSTHFFVLQVKKGLAYSFANQPSHIACNVPLIS